MLTTYLVKLVEAAVQETGLPIACTWITVTVLKSANSVSMAALLL